MENLKKEKDYLTVFQSEKPISEMTYEEMLKWAGQIWDGLQDTDK